MVNNSTPTPPWKGVGKRLESLLRKALYDYNMCENAHIAVALSGGKDSITLLILLAAVRGRGFPDFSLSAIHVAGEYSCGAGVNENFLHKLCSNINVPLYIEHSTKTLENLECYSCSRERRSLLFARAKEIGAGSVAFGHHRDDNAQTLLMNLMHKGEFAGMLPALEMHAYEIQILRPLIYADEKSILEFAKQQGFMRITCQCPVGQNSKRKEVDRLLDFMEEIFPNVRANIARASLHYGSDKAKRALQ